MAKVYYVGGLNSSNGILRCILPRPHLFDLVRSQQFVYIGAVFPSGCGGGPAAAILEISEDERPEALEPGFYRAQLAPVEFEESLKSLESASAPSLVK